VLAAFGSSNSAQQFVALPRPQAASATLYDTSLDGFITQDSFYVSAGRSEGGLSWFDPADRPRPDHFAAPGLGNAAWGDLSYDDWFEQLHTVHWGDLL